MALCMVVVSGLFFGITNFCMRRSIDLKGSTRHFLLYQLATSIIASVLLCPVRTGDYDLCTASLFLGTIGGLLYGAMMWAIAQAFAAGPIGLTVAILNSATVMPGIVMALLFGAEWGHPYNFWIGLGSALVLIGLFWAGWRSRGVVARSRWMKLAILAAGSDLILLCFLQWRALLVKGPWNISPFVPFALDIGRSQWFMPVLFLSAASIHLISVIRSERRAPIRAELLYGTLGGLANGLATFLLISATDIAAPWENAMLFPVSAVTVIIVCNLGGRFIYKEKVHWASNSLCLFGVLIGTIDWSHLLP